jgi:ABC-2 type transport system permease protein
MRKALAVFLRDAQFDLAVPLPFLTQWLAVVISVAGLFFVSHLVAPSPTLGFGGHRGNYFSYAVVNVAFMLLMTMAVQGFARTLRRDQILDLIEPIFATPTSVALLAFSSGLWCLTVSVLQVTLYLAVAALAFHLDLHNTDIGMLALFTVLSVACMSSLGVMSAGIVIYSKAEPPSGMIVGGVASLLGGVLFPVALLPAPLQAVSWLLPITHALAGIRGAIAGAHLAALRADALWLGVATAILLPSALFGFSYAINRARTDGTLAAY